MKKIIRNLVIAAAVAAVGVLVAKRVMKPAEAIQTKELPAVTLTQTEKGNIEKKTSLMGTIQPSDTYYVMPKAAGELLQIYVENGQTVKAGDPIAKIDNQKQVDAAKYALEQATVQAKTAQDALNRMTPLLASGDISQQDYESARSGADAAAAGVKAAQLAYDTQVEFSTVTAPAAGIVQNTAMTLHGTAAQTTQLCIITGTGAKTVNFNVTEDVLKNLTMGQEITVDKQGTPYAGTISDIGQVVNAQTGLFPVKATMQDASALPDGAAVKLTLTTQHAENTDLIPLDCVYYAAGEPYVYTYQDEKVKRSFIELGIENETDAQVLSGLDADAQIVNSWTNELYDGASVRLAVETTAADAAAAGTADTAGTDAEAAVTAADTAAAQETASQQ